jgi:hypothetical protein
MPTLIRSGHHMRVRIRLAIRCEAHVGAGTQPDLLDVMRVGAAVETQQVGSVHAPSADADVFCRNSARRGEHRLVLACAASDHYPVSAVLTLNVWPHAMAVPFRSTELA